ncbi:MAG: alpha-hydroxy acid oxidase [Candidatus Dactylopiibacterium sp.]|nr:alpha-hydroxy acid oxidase [Candidatus Dactylopiibacterium sp.]
MPGTEALLPPLDIAARPPDASPSPIAPRPETLPAPGFLRRRRLETMLCLDDFEAAARRCLPRPLFGYVSGAAERNASLHDNARAFEALLFAPRVLVNVAARSAAVSLFGREYSTPFGIAPMGIAALSAYRGDVALAQAAQEAGIAAILSGTSLIPLEEVIAAAPDTWFQAYLPGDPVRIRALIERVARAGVGTLVVTVDLPVSANRENNLRSGFSTPLRPSLRLAWDGLSHPGWLAGTFLRTLWRHGMPHFENSFATRGAPILSRSVARDFSARDHLCWEHLHAIRRQWQGPLVIKGVLSVADALAARQAGADGVILSNHGGRQLDGSASPLRLLPAVVDALGDYPVMLDGGVRRGSDVLKALALGARMVFVGRPFNYAAAVGGQAGVARAIQLLREEVMRNMAMLGVNACADLGRDHLLPAGRNPLTGTNLAADMLQPRESN